MDNKHIGITMIPLLPIFSKEAFKLFFLFQLKDFPGNPIVIATIWLTLQIIFASIFGYVSDKNYRKLVLLLTIGMSIISIPLIKYNFFWIAIIIDGIFCNITPIARAAYCDANPLINRTKLMTNSFIAQAIPWIILCWNNNVIKNYLYPISLFLAFLSLISIIILYKDTANKALQPIIKEIKDLKAKYFNRIFIKLAIAFILLEITYQIMPYFSEAHFNINNLQKAYLFLGIGIALGCSYHKFIKVSNHLRAINLIILGGLTLFFLEFLASYFTDKQYFIPLNIYLLFSFLGGLYWPLIYAVFSEKAKMHEEGLIFGLLDSLQSVAEVIPPFIMIWEKNEKLGYFPFFLLLVVAFYLTYKKGNLSNHSSHIKNKENVR